MINISQIYGIIIKTAIMYLTVTSAMRFMGKRQIGELSAAEIAVALLISEVASMPISDKEISLLHGIVSIAVLVILEIIISYLDIKFSFIMRISHGKPTTVIFKGKILEDALRKSRMSINELSEELRLKNTNISDVYIAIIETNGQISIIPNNSQNSDSNNNNQKNSDPVDFAVVVDGEIRKGNLELIGKNQYFVEKELKKRKVSLKNVFAMFADSNGVTFFQEKKK